MGWKNYVFRRFYYKEEYRRYGLGSLLFEAFIQDAKNQGARKLKWQVLDWNHTAKSFYIKFNAQIISGWENGVIEF
ncbi:MAG: GNAT family N-acetyltransferase [Saprospiraceae bacterium]|nr:GNAT family N-acetyltransferase [Saprospiraceae bacterium]